MPAALVVIPTYMEAENLPAVLRRVRAALPDGRVLVVDDNSPDGTADVARALAAELGGIDVLVREAKTGLGDAYRAGLAWGVEQGFDVLVEMDADLSHDPDTLPQLVGACAAGADLAIGSRYIPGGSTAGWKRSRRSLSRWANRYVGLALRVSVADSTSGFRAYRADLLRRIALEDTRADGYAFQVEAVYRAADVDAVIREVPITFTDRTIGSSKLSWHTVVEALALVTWWGIRARAGRPAVQLGAAHTPG